MQNKAIAIAIPDQAFSREFCLVDIPGFRSMPSLKQLLDLDIDLPIIQAPMAGVQDSALAIAVANAGGLGSLPCAMLNPTGINQQLQAIRQQTRRPPSFRPMTTTANSGVTTLTAGRPTRRAEPGPGPASPGR